LGFILVSFEVNGEKHHGSIHVSKITGRYIRNIYSLFNVGDIVKAKILTYNSRHLKWNLTCLNDSGEIIS
jgi:predicted RNA-binding protein with RPS1 domain